MKVDKWAVVDVNDFVIIICIREISCGNLQYFVVQFNTFGADLRVLAGIVNPSLFNDGERFDWLEFIKWMNC